MDDSDLIAKIKEKKEFRELPDSVISRILESLDSGLHEKERVKETRRVLRKYFGVFLTNKVIKPKRLLDFNSLLLNHKSSMKRDYAMFYKRIKKSLGTSVFGSIIDVGCGVNGFSYSYIRSVFGDVNYIGIEASGQIVSNTNNYFDQENLRNKCKVVHGDLFDLDFVGEILNNCEKTRLVFVFQVIDALENLERDFSKKFFLMIKEKSEFVVVSFPLVSLGGKKKFEVRRNWIIDFLGENFEILDDFNLFGERFICLKC